MSEEKSELKIIDKRMPANQEVVGNDTQPAAVVMAAIQKGMDPAFIEKMLDLQERHEKNEARKAYYEAVANFKAMAPKVKKDKYNKFFDSWYTSLGNLLDTYNPCLGKHGLSVSFPTPAQTETTMTVECQLAHRMGHTDSISITAPIDQAAIGKASGQRSRTPIQDIKSTFTYLRSATCEAILGVSGTEASAGDDNGNSTGGEINLFEQWSIKCDEVGKAAKSREDMAEWWKLNSATIKKELSQADAAKIYEARNIHVKKLKAAEREPGSDDQ